MANKRHIRLNDVRDVKKLMTKLINQRYRDEMEPASEPRGLLN